MCEAQYLENYLTGTLSPEDSLVMDARVLLDMGLNDKIIWQQRTYELVKAYGRKQLKMEIEKVHNQLFSEKRFSSFRQKIKNIFN
ncbi:MAG: hypothetical protein V4506_13555 [Bacteroidota bacterium]